MLCWREQATAGQTGAEAGSHPTTIPHHRCQLVSGAQSAPRRAYPPLDRHDPQPAHIKPRRWTVRLAPCAAPASLTGVVLRARATSTTLRTPSRRTRRCRSRTAATGRRRPPGTRLRRRWRCGASPEPSLGSTIGLRPKGPAVVPVWKLPRPFSDAMLRCYLWANIKSSNESGHILWVGCHLRDKALLAGLAPCWYPAGHTPRLCRARR